jgi:hypothetical protein
MKDSFFFAIDATVLCLFLFLGCLIMVVVGKKLRDKFLLNDEHESKGGVGALLGGLFGLWGFLLAFTFGNVSSRYEHVRASMVDEVSIIRTVILKAELFPDSIQRSLHADMKQYLQSTIDYYQYFGDKEKFTKSKQDAKETGMRLWTRTVEASFLPSVNLSATSMLSSLSEMYDIGARRDSLLKSGLPGPISKMLFFVALVISFVGGFTSPVLRIKEWIVIIGFIFLACLIIYITLDLARPMSGFIRPELEQHEIEQLRELL